MASSVEHAGGQLGGCRPAAKRRRIWLLGAYGTEALFRYGDRYGRVDLVAQWVGEGSAVGVKVQ
jgi:hypothetical protein